VDGRRHRLLSTRSEQGAATLAEVVVAMVLAALLLGVVTVVASSTERVVSLSGADFAAQRSAAQVLSSGLSSISDASPLGACQSAGGPVYTTALSGCAHVTQGASAVAAASSSGPPIGLCWYSYPDSAVGLVAPDLRCLVAYGDGELWAFDWPPASAQSTYTNCDPTSCFGQGAPAPGQLPPEPSGPEGVATLAGEVSQPGDAISFYDQGGGVLSLSASSSAAALSRVYKVDVKVAETWGAGPDLSAYSSTETYTAVVGQAVWQGQQQAAFP
jgi:hypothetical protein